MVWCKVKLTDMQAIVAMATKRPWHNGKSIITEMLGEEHCGAAYSGDEYVADTIGSKNETNDLTLILHLANHADALLELWLACLNFSESYGGMGEIIAALAKLDAT